MSDYTGQGRRGPWECFHCGEVFTTVDAASDHFGEPQEDAPGCLIALRKAEARIRELEARLSCVPHEETVRQLRERAEIKGPQ